MVSFMLAHGSQIAEIRKQLLKKLAYFALNVKRDKLLNVKQSVAVSFMVVHVIQSVILCHGKSQLRKRYQMVQRLKMRLMTITKIKKIRTKHQSLRSDECIYERLSYDSK